MASPFSWPVLVPYALRAPAPVNLGVSSDLLYAVHMNTITFNFKALPVTERIELVEDIWNSIAEETAGGLQLSSGEVAELQRRLSQHQQDPSTSVPWEQVRSALFQNQ